MIMYVVRNTNDESDTMGSLAGIAKSAFLGRSGIPIFFTEEQIEIHESYRDNAERPTPGMVGRSMRENLTYVVAADGEVYQIESPWPTLQSYAKAVEKAADFECRNERLLKELLTEEAALGLLNYVIDTYDHFNAGGDLARQIFEEFKVQQGA